MESNNKKEGASTSYIFTLMVRLLVNIPVRGSLRRGAMPAAVYDITHREREKGRKETERVGGRERGREKEASWGRKF